MLENILLKNNINIFNVTAKQSLTCFPEEVTYSVAKYFEEKGENVVYFPLQQIFNYSLEEVEAISMAYKLEKGKDLISYISNIFDLSIREWDLKEIKKDQLITSGALRIIHYFISVYAAPQNPVIIINKYSQGLHPNIKENVMKFILNVAKPKYLIVTTYEFDFDANFNFHHSVSIQNIEKLSEALIISNLKSNEVI